MEHFASEHNALYLCVYVEGGFPKEYIKLSIQDIHTKASFIFMILNTVFATGCF